jgi:WXG100 family type VII secretion target
MARTGADLEELAQLSAALLQQSRTIEQVTAAVRGKLANTTWHGPAAERFRSAWSSDFEPSLHRLQAALQDAGMEVDRRRDALFQAGG